MGPSRVASNIYEAQVEVGTGKDAFYGYWVELGTGASFDAATARALGYPGSSKPTAHNVKPQPFLLPAVKATEVASIAAMEAVLQQEIKKAETA
jgi:hypothetical protein